MPIYKTKKGQYRVQVNFKDPLTNEYKSLVRCNKNTTTLAAAKKIESDLLLNYTSITSTPGSNLNYEDLWNEYYVRKKDELRITTLDKKARINNLYIMPYFKNKQINRITVNDIQIWKSKINKYNLQFVTKCNIYKHFNSIINYAYKYHSLPFNPVSKAGNFINKNLEVKSLRYWTKEQFDIFINELREDAITKNDLIFWGYYTFFNIAFYTGARKGENESLTWNDYQEGKITVSKSLTQKIKGETWMILPPKNKSSIRSFSISDKLKTVLDEHKQRYSRVYAFDNDWFISGGLEPLKDTSIEKIMNYYAKKLGLPKIRVHDLRHSFASLLINGNVNIKVISQLLGHTNVEMTWNVYSHLYPNAEKEAINYIDNL